MFPINYKNATHYLNEQTHDVYSVYRERKTRVGHMISGIIVPIYLWEPRNLPIRHLIPCQYALQMLYSDKLTRDEHQQLRTKCHTRKSIRIIRKIARGFYEWYTSNGLHHARNMVRDLNEMRMLVNPSNELTFDELFECAVLKYYCVY